VFSCYILFVNSFIYSYFFLSLTILSFLLGFFFGNSIFLLFVFFNKWR
jgi:hypothetical protein